MKSECQNPVRKIKRLRDGKYPGRWSGYQVEFHVAGIEHNAEVVKGIRGIDIPCEVTVVNGAISVETTDAQ